ncbi:MAG: hypothetical protein LUE21_02990 [Oscillospiraceae bacterium]|nr:hypothetical protein [Oscillospiraceae bacterium]
MPAFMSALPLAATGMDAFGLWTGNYSINWTQSEKKDVLAQEYFSYLN